MPATKRATARRTASMAVRCVRSLAAAAIAVTLLAGPASAAQTEAFGIEPYPLFAEGTARRVFDLQISPGATWTDRVRVWNRSDEPLELRLYGAGAANDGGRYTVAAYEARARDAGAWVAVEPATLRLDPGEERIVSITVQAPARLPQRDEPWLGAIVAEGATGVSASGVDVVARLAILLVMEPGGGGLFGLHPLVLVALALFALLGGAHVARSVRRRSAARRELGLVR